MMIHGLQKLTLLDYPGKTAATVFLGGCDLNCPYCHNRGLITGEVPPLISDEELFSFLEKRKGLLDAVVISGGEPCLNKGLISLAASIKDMGYFLKLDTNGNHPEVLKELLDRGLLDYAAMDIKNSPSKYPVTTGAPDLDIKRISESITILLHSSIDYEFRTTVIKHLHEEEDFRLIGEWIKGAKNYYLQQFVLRESVEDKSLEAPSPEEMERFCALAAPYVQKAAVRGV